MLSYCDLWAVADHSQMNTVQKGHDINVTRLWLEGITGHNATVAIVDDGLDMYSNDLKDNYVGIPAFRLASKLTGE